MMSIEDAIPHLRHVVGIVKKRDSLCRNPPKCPECGSVQVQLKNWTRPGKAEWRCRTDCGCGHRWVVDVVDDPMVAS